METTLVSAGGPFLILIGVALVVWAARHRAMGGNGRAVAIGAGMALLVIGLFSLMASTNPALGPWVAPTIIGAAVMGAGIGYWAGRQSGAPVR
jgi:protein-S-isoprenylcysteine O-methyltransferase Ste14